MINDRIKLTIENHVAHAYLARPDKMNALDSKMFDAIPMLGEQLRDNPEVRAVVVSGEGGNFCAGLDKSNFTALLEKQGLNLSDNDKPLALAERTHGIANLAQYAVWMWRQLPMPVIAAIDGVAFGGGLQIALGADMRFAAANSQFSIMEMRWGIVPDMGSSQILRHLVRDDIIRELTYTAKLFNAEQAKQWGFVTEVVDDPLAHAMQVAQEIVGKNPQAIQSAKRVIEQSYYLNTAEGLLMESEEQDSIIGSPNQIEAVVAELQSRKPQFSD